MPAAPAARPPPQLPPAPGRPALPAPGRRGRCDSLRYLSSKLSKRKLQGAWLPAGRGPLERPLLGPHCPVSPVSIPTCGRPSAPTRDSVPKARVVTVVQLGGPPLRKATLILTRHSVATFEQLLADISDALGCPRCRGDGVRRLFNLKGREVRSVSDFFREGDAFLAMGKEPLTLKSIQAAAKELHPSKSGVLTPALPSQALSPRLRSRLQGRLLRGGPCCGDNGTGGEAAGAQVATKPPTGPAPEDKARARKRWARGRQEPEARGQPAREDPVEASVGGEKALGVEAERTCREPGRCEACGRDRPWQGLQGGQQPAPERLGRARSCRRCPEANPAAGDKGWKGDGHRGSPQSPSQELSRPSKSVDKKENRDPKGQKGHLQGVAKAREDPVEVPLGTQEGPRAMKDAGPACRNRHSWLPGDPRAEPLRPPRSLAGEKEAMEEKQPNAPPGKMTALRGDPPAKAEKEPRPRPEESKAEQPGQKPRPTGIIMAAVEKHYETGRVIGDGNFAIVKECRHRDTRQAYAMKVIDKSKLKGREDIVDSEILIIQSLSHPNIVKLHEVYETEAEIYLVMEYVQGGDLFDAIIESVKFAEPEAALMITDVCKALVHMHDRRIVHRDLKPENLLVQRNEDKSTTLKLADFGLAKHVVRPIFTVCGTPTYVAPEILSEKGYGLEVDMWAAGVILYILLCGFPPFRSPDRDQDELFSIIQRGHFEFLTPYWDNISDAAKDLVSRLLVVDPKKRYTAHQVLQHPWIETAGRTGTGDLQKEGTPSSKDPWSQHKRVAEQAL